MKYRIFFISLFIIFQAPAAAANERYRVEVLVLQHLDHSEQAQEIKNIRDFSAATDFLVPPPEEAEPQCEPGVEEIDEAPGGDLSIVADGDDVAASPDEMLEEEEVPPDPNAVVHIEEMGPEMQEAWRRLRLSGPFRPLQFLSWEQGSEEPFPSLRVHDQTVVLTDDPWADLRLAEAELALVYGDTVPEPGAGPATDGCIEPPVDDLPGPTLHYALDGKVSLVRTRFLHLHLDLQLREPLAEPDAAIAGNNVPAMIPGGDGRDQGPAPVPRPDAFLAYELRQNRQVRSGRMEYFDGPVIGVLAWITSIPLEDTAER